MKKTLVIFGLVSILFVAVILILIYFIQVPCGGMTKEGALWDGTCSYGPLLIENLKNGHFFLPF